jgi:hypothetical protein
VGERSLHTREVAGSKPAAPIGPEARRGGLSAIWATTLPQNGKRASLALQALRTGVSSPREL